MIYFEQKTLGLSVLSHPTRAYKDSKGIIYNRRAFISPATGFSKTFLVYESKGCCTNWATVTGLFLEL